MLLSLRFNKEFENPGQTVEACCGALDMQEMPR